MKRIQEAAPIDYSSTRLDIYLLLKNNDLSRNFIANAIKKGLVKVNNEIVTKSSHRVKNEDDVQFDSDSARQLIEQTDYENVQPISMKLDIVFEDDDILVINKASGIATHPSHGHVDNTLLNGVHAYLHSSEKEYLNSRKHMVHRLDKDTSGLILFAKTDKMLWWLHRQFADRNISKHYYALGISSKKYNINEIINLEGYLERSRREKKLYMFSLKYGRWTNTIFTVLKNYIYEDRNIRQNFVLVDCQPKTGRTHQIRVHLKHLNLPIWGDPLYSSDKQFNMVEKIAQKLNLSNRLFLQAYKLEFTSYNGKKYSFEIPLNSELQKIISALNEK